MQNIETTDVLGVSVSAIDMDMALAAIESWIDDDVPNYVCVTGVHGIMESQSNKEVRDSHNGAGLVTPDGMPLVWLQRSAGKKHVRRVYGPDLMLAVMERSHSRGDKHFLYGSTEKTLERLQSNLTRRFPGLTIAGSFSPPFRPLTDTEDDEVVATIDASGADIVWVGLSTPKQERWMATHRHRLTAPVLIGVGAAFDFHAGLVRQAPRFIQQSGFEWLFRLATEPRRLWRRYLSNNPMFVYLVARQMLGLRDSFNN